MRENLAAVDLTLSRDEIDAINGLERDARASADPAEASFTQM